MSQEQLRGRSPHVQAADLQTGARRGASGEPIDVQPGVWCRDQVWVPYYEKMVVVLRPIPMSGIHDPEPYFASS